MIVYICTQLFMYLFRYLFVLQCFVFSNIHSPASLCVYIIYLIEENQIVECIALVLNNINVRCLFFLYRTSTLIVILFVVSQIFRMPHVFVSDL